MCYICFFVANFTKLGINLQTGLNLFPELSVQKLARQRYDDLVKGFGEYLVSGSDDFTLFLWTPEKDKKSIGNLVLF